MAQQGIGPGTAPDALTDFKGFESDLQPVHRGVVENGEIHQGGDEEKIQIPCIAEAKTQGFSLRAYCFR